MKIILEPKVKLVSVQNFMPHPTYEIPFDEEQNYAHQLIAFAGKGCYDSYGKDGRPIEEHIRSLLASKHGSVIEHYHVSLFIEGISRGCSHEIVRHRHFAFSQRSTRYTAEDNAAIVLEPYYAELYKEEQVGSPELGKLQFKNELLNTFLVSCERSIQEYKKTVELLLEKAPNHLNKTERRKWARGKARQLLPHALETRITMTGNLRAWRWFLESRGSRHAEAEIRRLAYYIFKELRGIAPLIFEDFATVDLQDGTLELVAGYNKI